MWRRVIWTLALLFGLLNVVVALHAWRFTHFTTAAEPRTRNPEKLPTSEKIRIVLTGLRNPKPVNLAPPAFLYHDALLSSPNGQLAAWYGPVPKARGTVVLCHTATPATSRGCGPRRAIFGSSATRCCCSTSAAMGHLRVITAVTQCLSFWRTPHPLAPSPKERGN